MMMDVQLQPLSKGLLPAVVISSSLAIAWIIYLSLDSGKEGTAAGDTRDDTSTKRGWWPAAAKTTSRRRSRRRSTPSAYVSNRLDAHRRLKNLNRSDVSIDMVKLQRWERLIPKLTMKRPMYDNIRMYDPDGGLLCTISLKKAQWYVRKDLGVWKDETQSSIRLLFRPNKDGKEVEEDAFASYNQSVKQNRCVACGRQDQGYMRFYIVPYCYRTHFPTLYKSHMPHDVVLLCPACQIPALQASQRRQTQLERPFADGGGSFKYRTNPQIRHLRKLAGALCRPELPPDRRSEYTDDLRDFLGTDDISQEQIEAVLQLEEKVLNPDYVSPSELLVKSLLQAPAEDSTIAPDDDSESPSNPPRSLEALEEFVREWRHHFVATMRPGHLPQGWSVDSPVRCQGSSSVSSASA